MYATTSTKSGKSSIIEDLLYSRKRILDLAKKEPYNEYPRKDIESSITITPGKLLTTAKTTLRDSNLLFTSKFCLFNNNSIRKFKLKVKQNPGDYNEDIKYDEGVNSKLNEMVSEYACNPLKEANVDIEFSRNVRIFLHSNRSISIIKEGEKESYSGEVEDDFKTAKSNDNAESLILRLEGIDLAEENAELKLENKRLKELYQQEISKLKQELAETKKELNKTLKEFDTENLSPA